MSSRPMVWYEGWRRVGSLASPNLIRMFGQAASVRKEPEHDRQYHRKNRD